MATYYEFIGAKPDATQEEVAKLFEITERRLHQTGQINDERYEVALRKIRDVLLDPENRKAYDKKLGIVAKANPQRLSAGHQRVGAKASRPRFLPRIGTAQRVVIMGAILAVLAIVAGFSYWQSTRSWPTGHYLLRPGSGTAVAVILSREVVHVYPNGYRGPAYKVKILETGELMWATEAQIRTQWGLGGAAPASDLQVK